MQPFPSSSATLRHKTPNTQVAGKTIKIIDDDMQRYKQAAVNIAKDLIVAKGFRGTPDSEQAVVFFYVRPERVAEIYFNLTGEPLPKRDAVLAQRAKLSTT